MIKALRIHETGGPEVFVWEEVELNPPGPGEARLRHTAIGVNFVDTYHRGGVPHPWPLPPLPAIIGLDGVGVVETVGPEVIEVEPGDRVAYAMPPLGAYCQARNMPKRATEHGFVGQARVFRPQGLVVHDRGEHASCRPAPHFIAVLVPDGDIEALSAGEL